MTRTSLKMVIALVGAIGAGAPFVAHAQDVPGCPGIVGAPGTTDTLGRPCSEMVRKSRNNAAASDGISSRGTLDSGPTVPQDTARPKPSTGVDGLPGLPDTGPGLPGTSSWQHGGEP